MTFSAIFAVFALFEAFMIASRVFAVLFIVFSCKHYNETISAGMCVLAVFFPLIATIVHLVKRTHFQGMEMNVCRQCGEKLPPSYEVCPRCLAPLEPYDETKTKKSKTVSNVMLAVFSACKAVSVVCVVIFFVAVFSAAFSAASEAEGFQQQRISVTEDGQEIYYDKKGNSYDNPDDVVIYSKDGTKYLYDDDISCFVSDSDEEYEAIYCYVDSKGWFYYDADDALYFGNPEVDKHSGFGEEELMAMKIEDFFGQLLSFDGSEVWYDDEGNVYYSARYASWNEKGKLITEQYEAMP